jgi:hypothetical protein
VLLVPADHRREGLDDGQRAHPWLLERGHRGVAESQPADDDVQLRTGARGQPQPRQLDLGDREQARHEELLTELDLVHVDLEGALEAAAQDELAHLGVLPVQLLEASDHGPTSRSLHGTRRPHGLR